MNHVFNSIKDQAIDTDIKAEKEKDIPMKHPKPPEPHKYYGISMKSHCETPDFEDECMARNKEEAVEKMWKDRYGIEAGWDKEEFKKHIRELK